MSMKNQEELLVRYPSPYKVVDGNLCMEVTEKHSKYDKKLANFTPYIKSELTVDDGATETKVLRLAGQHANGETLPEIEVSGKEFPSFNWLFENGAPNVFWRLARTSKSMYAIAFSQLPKVQNSSLFISRQAGRKSETLGAIFCPETASLM